MLLKIHIYPTCTNDSICNIEVYINIQVTYELTFINSVARGTVHRK